MAMNAWMHECMNERMNEWMNEWMNEPAESASFAWTKNDYFDY